MSTKSSETVRPTMSVPSAWRLASLALAVCSVATTLTRNAITQDPLIVCATTPDLAALAREVGGPDVAVRSLTKGREDPHFVDAKPSFITRLHRADLFVQVGLGLEQGWVPALLRSAQNRHILRGGRGFLDASSTIPRLRVPAGPVDRSMGDVHERGNPHYLLDPVAAVRVARAIGSRLSALRPARAEAFGDRVGAFADRIAERLVGAELREIYGADGAMKLARLFESGKLKAFLTEQGHEARLAGWIGLLLPYRGTRVVVDHDLWPYFTRRFGLEVVAHFEPKPGIPPTTKHLTEVVRLMRAGGTGVVLASGYFNPRYARFVAEKTGATVVPMAHQTGSRPGTVGYVEMVDYNVKQVAEALAGRGR